MTGAAVVGLIIAAIIMLIVIWHREQGPHRARQREHLRLRREAWEAAVEAVGEDRGQLALEYVAQLRHRRITP